MEKGGSHYKELERLRGEVKREAAVTPKNYSDCGRFNKIYFKVVESKENLTPRTYFKIEKHTSPLHMERGSSVHKELK